MMDRPLGPRQPDKRVTAYESIFGRPSVSHQSSPQSYSPSPSYPQNPYPYPSASPQHYPSPSTSYSPSSYQRSPRQSIYGPPPPQNQAWPYPNYTYHQPQYPQSTLSPVPNTHLAYPDDSADPNFVAYQAQAYHNSAAAQQGPQGPWGPRPPPPPQQQQQPAYEYEQYQNGAASRSIPHLGVNIDVDSGRLGLDFDDESSPSDTDDSELPWAAASHSCKYHSKRTSSTANRPVPFQPAGSPTTSHIIKDFSQHMPTTVFPPNDNSLPQIRTLFAQLIPAIPALLPHLPPGHIHCSSTLPT
jgi:hypothetical protein